jgi:hypothetical protein
VSLATLQALAPGKNFKKKGIKKEENDSYKINNDF